MAAVGCGKLAAVGCGKLAAVGCGKLAAVGCGKLAAVGCGSLLMHVCVYVAGVCLTSLGLHKFYTLRNYNVNPLPFGT